MKFGKAKIFYRQFWQFWLLEGEFSVRMQYCVLEGSLNLSFILISDAPLLNVQRKRVYPGEPVWNSNPVPEFIDPVSAKTSPKRSFSVIENWRFGLVFAKTGSINSGTGLTCGGQMSFVSPRLSYASFNWVTPLSPDIFKEDFFFLLTFFVLEKAV